MAGELLLQLAELVETIVENRSGQSGVGVPCTEHLHEIRGSARTARRDHGNAHRVGYGARQFAIEAAAGAIAIHGCEEDLARAAGLRFPCPLDRISARGRSSAAAECFPARAAFRAFGIDSHNHRLRAKALCDRSDQTWVCQCGRVDADLIRACLEDLDGIAKSANASSYCKGNE